MSKFILSIIIAITCLYNIPLGILLLFYLLNTQRRLLYWYIDIPFVAILLLIGLINLDIASLLNQPTILWHYYLEHGQLGVFGYEISNWKLIYSQGLCIVLVIPLSIYIYYQLYLQKIIELNLITGKILQKDTLTGVFLGRYLGDNVTLINKELNQHCLIVGTTGSGKTTTLLNFVTSAAKQGFPMVYLDGKGSIDLINNLQNIANKYNRNLKVFTLRPILDNVVTKQAGYNPFYSGSPTQWKNRIMALFEQAQSKGQEHFALGEQNYINFVANVLAKLNKPIDLRVILAFLEHPDKLLALAHDIEPEIGRKLAKLHNDTNINKLIGNVVKMLELFIYSDYGHLFNTLEMDNVIKLRDCILNKEMVLFLFDASAYPEDTKKVARMVINDLNSSLSDIGSFTPCYCIFDEFASYASENLAETISLQRSNGMHAIIGTQSITTVKLKSLSTKRIAEELIASCNTYIIHTINHNDDAEIFAKLMGTKQHTEIITHLESVLNSKITKTSMHFTDKFKVGPQVFKDLRQGEVVLYRKVTGSSPIKLHIIQTD